MNSIRPSFPNLPEIWEAKLRVERSTMADEIKWGIFEEVYDLLAAGEMDRAAELMKQFPTLTDE